jgi:probable FeS assembly SUF system protein SufT
MNKNDPITLSRDVDATVVPVGMPVVLEKGSQAFLTQSLGGSYTVVVNGNMFRIDGKNADALGLTVTAPAPQAPASTPEQEAAPVTPEVLEKRVWDALRSCYDPEIPVNVADLGLIYDCQVVPLGTASSYKVEVKMTLTAPGCGMGPMIAQDVQNKILALDGVEEATVELVWDPPWSQQMMTEAARLQLGLY